MAERRPTYFWHRFFVGWFLLCALLNVGYAVGFCQWFAWAQHAVLIQSDQSALLNACQATWAERWFTPRYVVAVLAALSVAAVLVKNPDRGYTLAQWYLLIGILLRFMFNVFPHTGPDAGLFPLPPGISEEPPVYLMPVAVGVVSGFIQIIMLTVVSLQRIPRFRREAQPELFTYNGNNA